MTIPTTSALRALYNNHFSGTIPASLASSASLHVLYVPYPDQIDSRLIGRNVSIYTYIYIYIYIYMCVCVCVCVCTDNGTNTGSRYGSGQV